jgi:N-dimethylarginine dimethylaminohydrolase
MSDNIHQLLKESVEKIATQWVEQLNVVRANTVALEEQVLACLAKTKSDIQQMHELGVKVTEEAKRGREICAQLGAGVALITGEPLAFVEEPKLIEKAAEVSL